MLVPPVFAVSLFKLGLNKIADRVFQAVKYSVVLRHLDCLFPQVSRVLEVVCLLFNVVCYRMSGNERVKIIARRNILKLNLKKLA